jgi:hypothetical protein
LARDVGKSAAVRVTIYSEERSPRRPGDGVHREFPAGMFSCRDRKDKLKDEFNVNGCRAAKFGEGFRPVRELFVD